MLNTLLWTAAVLIKGIETFDEKTCFVIVNGVNRHSDQETKGAKCGHVKDQAAITQLSTIMQAIYVIENVLNEET